QKRYHRSSTSAGSYPLGSSWFVSLMAAAEMPARGPASKRFPPARPRRGGGRPLPAAPDGSADASERGGDATRVVAGGASRGPAPRDAGGPQEVRRSIPGSEPSRIRRSISSRRIDSASWGTTSQT